MTETNRTYEGVAVLVPCYNEEDSIDAFYDAVRQVTEEQIRFIQENADHYVRLSAQYMEDGLSVGLSV